MTDEQINLLLKEIKGLYKKRMEDLFHELMMLSNKPQAHLFGGTTYKVELTPYEWSAIRERYLND